MHFTELSKPNERTTPISTAWAYKATNTADTNATDAKIICDSLGVATEWWLAGYTVFAFDYPPYSVTEKNTK